MSVDKSSVLKKLRESDAIYVLMSDCTRMPFVVCDPETYDDEVFVFFSEEDAMRGGQEFLKANNPLKIFNIEKKYLLPFYSSLFPIGVNRSRAKNRLRIRNFRLLQCILCRR